MPKCQITPVNLSFTCWVFKRFSEPRHQSVERNCFCLVVCNSRGLLFLKYHRCEFTGAATNTWYSKKLTSWPHRCYDKGKGPITLCLSNGQHFLLQAWYKNLALPRRLFPLWIGLLIVKCETSNTLCSPKSPLQKMHPSWHFIPLWISPFAHHLFK